MSVDHATVPRVDPGADPGDRVGGRGGDGDPGGPGARPRRRPMFVGVSLVVVLAVAAVVVASRDGDGGAGGGTSAATTTVPVEVRDLVVNEELTGELGFGESASALAGRSGVVTGVSPVGSTVGQGGVLFHLDLQPTVLLHGEIPGFRDMSVDADPGTDIAQLEAALVALGHGDGITVDGNFTAATADAVESWEEELGRSDPDGVVTLGDVLFAPADLRVEAVIADRGTQLQSGAEVIAVTATSKVVTLHLTVDEASAVEAGTPVGLELPDGTETTGVIADVATEPTSDDAAPDGGGGSGDETYAVVVTLDDPSAAAGYDSGGVGVSIEAGRTDGATAVPVTALLALAEGGYAVQVVDDSRPEGYALVAVEVGMLADEWVQVTGEGIEAGVDVVVPA